MIKYFNIDRNLNIVLTEDKKVSTKELEQIFISEINATTNVIYDLNKISGKQYRFKIDYNNYEVELIAVIKNITGAGWENKPNVKRVQVRNCMLEDNENISKSNINKLNVIIGVYCYDNNPIFVAWDAYRYYNHKTQRSCYVTTDSLIQGYKKKFYDGIDSSQKIWIFKGDCFAKFVNSYVEYIGGNKLNE